MSTPSSHVEGPLWKGTTRYQVLRRIGQGGMGVVYEALDRQRNQRIALKTLPYFDADAFYRFKQEFRTLAGVHHANLVHLYELVATEGGQVFFTMELVTGADFLSFVRGQAAPKSLPPPSAIVTMAAAPGAPGAPPGFGEQSRAASATRTAWVETERLRPALRQLVQGVHAIHSAGRLHRDLKPSNVLVNRDGRVVILDFGVATELRDVDTAGAAGSGEVVGTARYMAPEQVGIDEGPAPASDWYSVGVMLYEALVGRPPFVGSVTDVLALKNAIDPVPPSDCFESIPADLDALCTALLRRDPEQRPSGEEILRRLGASRSSAPPAPPGAVDTNTAFIGRESQLQALRDAFEASRAGRSLTVRVGGAAGMGKSTIVNNFLDELVRSGEAVVLRGRAYEREEVPYKAVDTVIDALSRHLVRLVEADEPVDLPVDMGALARLFPVLQRVTGVAPLSEEPAHDPLGFRRRAFAALRELLNVLGSRRPVVLFVDDAQWGDVDSATLLLDLLRPPTAPPLLFLMTHRDGEEALASPFLNEMRERWPERAEVRDVTAGPLMLEDARRLALTLLESADPLAQRTARAVAREARGSPFLIEELVRSNRGVASETGATLSVLTLDQMVSERLERLTPAARRVTEIIAVGGRPMPLAVVGAAADVANKINELVAFVCARRFMRAGVRGGRDVVEPIHDRIRETIVSLLPEATLRAHHERLAEVLEARRDSDPDAIASHWIEGGHPDRAAPHACAAADQAYAAMAYERAARLYARAIELVSDPATKLNMQSRRADALASAGRVAEAAPAFLNAAAHATPVDALDLRRKAAEQFVMAANFDAANAALREVLTSVGMRLPSSRFGLLLLLLAYRALLWVRGLRFRVRQEASLRKAALVRMDTCSVVARMFGVTDPLLGVYFQTRFLLLALRHGEPYRLTYALCLEGAYRAVAGVKATANSDQAFEHAKTVIRVSGNDRAKKIVASAMHAFAALVQGRSQEALALADRAVATIRGIGLGGGLYWGLRAAQLNGLWALGDLGEFKELAARLTRTVDEANGCGDVWTATTMRASATCALASLCDHEPDQIREWIDASVRLWPQRVYHNQHLFGCMGLTALDLYEGNGRTAFDRMSQEFLRAKRAFKFKMEVLHTQARDLRARAALLAAAQTTGAERRRLMAVARGDSRWLRRVGPPYALPAAALAEAALAHLEGDQSRCAGALREAMVLADAGSARLVAAAARIQLGRLTGASGRTLLEAGEAFMRAQRIVNPIRMAETFCPINLGTRT